MLLLIILFVCNSNSLDLKSEISSFPCYRNSSVLENLVSGPKKYIADLMSNDPRQYSGYRENEDLYLNGTELIKKYGHKVEEHHVKTSDGYNLALYRIPGKGRVVLLMHGLLSSFVDWITVGPQQALPYLLANEGYDVWLGNARGNTYSRKHDRLSPSDPKFWEFSFHEIGTRDLPAMIDYVLEKTKKKKLTYIGHSQGTTAFFVLCTMEPKYNDKIEFMVALSAVAWMNNVPSPIIQIAALFHEYLYSISKSMNVTEILPDNETTRNMTLFFCGDIMSAALICQNIMYLIAGFDFAQVYLEQLPVIYNHLPSGSSLMQFEHYAQLIRSGYFRQFDHGVDMNLKTYGSEVPPSYSVENISVPVAIFFSQGDWLASTTDVDTLRRKLKNVVSYSEVRVTSFNHVDFLWAKRVKELVYDKVLALLKQH